MIGITESFQPLLALLCPAVGSILILIFGKRRNVRETWTLLASLFQFLVILSMVPTILNGKRITCYLFTMFPGIDFGFYVDAFGLLFALTVSSLWILVSLYSVGYMRALKEHAQTRFISALPLLSWGQWGLPFLAIW
jgi:NADH:ubiquinone oxidoreductase subunit 5 (subunit L)/multisubunit Na+/H+ antiporter MnhA subunit